MRRPSANASLSKAWLTTLTAPGRMLARISQPCSMARPLRVHQSSSSQAITGQAMAWLQAVVSAPPTLSAWASEVDRLAHARPYGTGNEQVTRPLWLDSCNVPGPPSDVRSLLRIWWGMVWHVLGHVAYTE
mmetsp:Transcript_14445/g.19473  ORF Transcript_14445/g.19473 Transcript_14445/m.19473 type:complete len:131 (-) Transcript_14445:168-560(-)